MMTAYGLIKLSAIAFYYRCFCPTKRSGFSIVCLVTAVLVLIWTVVFIVLIIFGCGVPLWANWGSPDARIHCPISLTGKHIGLMISDLLIDVFIICLPIPQVSTPTPSLCQERTYLPTFRFGSFIYQSSKRLG